MQKNDAQTSSAACGSTAKKIRSKSSVQKSPVSLIKSLKQLCGTGAEKLTHKSSCIMCGPSVYDDVMKVFEDHSAKYQLCALSHGARYLLGSFIY